MSDAAPGHPHPSPHRRHRGQWSSYPGASMASGLDTLGSAISITPFYSINYNGLDANFSKALSNDFNRLGEKWANRRLSLTVRAFLRRFERYVAKPCINLLREPQEFQDLPL